MDYISTTQLRTKSKELINTLKRGKKVKLVHRSQVIGEITPDLEFGSKPFNVKKFQAAIKALNLPKTTHQEREKNYRRHLEKKYGKPVS
jgi:hypothetical protein